RSRARGRRSLQRSARRTSGRRRPGAPRAPADARPLHGSRALASAPTRSSYLLLPARARGSVRPALGRPCAPPRSSPLACPLGIHPLPLSLIQHLVELLISIYVDASAADHSQRVPVHRAP